MLHRIRRFFSMTKLDSPTPQDQADADRAMWLFGAFALVVMVVSWWRG